MLLFLLISSKVNWSEIVLDYNISYTNWQIDALRTELYEFFGKDPMESKDMSRIVNLYHFTRVKKLMEEDGVSEKIVLGGQSDAMQLWVFIIWIEYS